MLLVQHSVNPTIRNEMKGKSRSSRTKPLYLALLVLERQLVLLLCHHTGDGIHVIGLCHVVLSRVRVVGGCTISGCVLRAWCCVRLCGCGALADGGQDTFTPLRIG